VFTVITPARAPTSYTPAPSGEPLQLGQYGGPDARSVNRRLALIAKRPCRAKP